MDPRRKSCLLIRLKTAANLMLSNTSCKLQHLICTRQHGVALCAHRHAQHSVPRLRVRRGAQHMMCFCVPGHCGSLMTDETLFKERHWEVSRCSGWWNNMMSYKEERECKVPKYSEWMCCGAMTSALHCGKKIHEQIIRSEWLSTIKVQIKHPRIHKHIEDSHVRLSDTLYLRR